MTITPEQIDDLRKASSEHQRLEFKEAKKKFSIQKLYEYCVAIANEGGGHLLLGVADKPPRPIVSTQAFPNPVKTEEKVFQKLRFRVEIEEVKHPEGRVLVFKIPSRPPGSPHHLDGKYLMRSGSALVPMTPDRLRSIFAESPPDWDHPLSTDDAVASLKQYMSDSRYRIQLSDFVDESVERVVEVTSGEAFKVQNAPDPDRESITARVRGYHAACSTLLAMAINGGFWAEEEHYFVWQRALQRLGWTTATGGYAIWIGLKEYPATLLLYALGLGAIEAERLRFLGSVLGTTIRREHKEDLPAVRILPPFCLPSVYRKEIQKLEGMDGHFTPLNDWIHQTLRPCAERIIPDDERYTLDFDKLEILIALNFAHKAKPSSEPYWAPPGPFVWRYRYANRIPILQEIEESLSTMKAESPYVTCGIFGETVAECQQGVKALEQFISKLPWYGW